VHALWQEHWDPYFSYVSAQIQVTTLLKPQVDSGPILESRVLATGNV